VRWTWWDWSLSLGTLLSSVLWHRRLGHLTRKTVPKMTYNVFSGTLNPTHFEVNSKYSNSSLFEFLNARTVLGRHSVSILTAFVQHSRHLPTRHHALFGQQLNCTHMAFEVHSEHYNSILNIPTVFQLLSSCIRELNTRNVQESFDAGLQWIRSIRTAFLIFKKMRVASECVSNFENCNSGWFCFISAKCDGGFKKVRCTRDIVQSFFSNKVINRCNELDQSAVDATSINAFKLIRESQEWLDGLLYGLVHWALGLAGRWLASETIHMVSYNTW